jgi:hypothetical protein
MELYIIIGIVEGAVSNRAGSIALVFHGSVSFALFIFNPIHSYRRLSTRLLEICI